MERKSRQTDRQTAYEPLSVRLFFAHNARKKKHKKTALQDIPIKIEHLPF
jgi:hypothetical protein